MTTEEILAEAARLVEEKWSQRYPTTRQEGFCAFGAIRYASGSRNSLDGDFNSYFPALAAVCKEIGLEKPAAGCLGDWNDAPGRTKEEVATALRNAKRWL